MCIFTIIYSLVYISATTLKGTLRSDLCDHYKLAGYGDKASQEEVGDQAGRDYLQ